MTISKLLPWSELWSGMISHWSDSDVGGTPKGRCGANIVVYDVHQGSGEDDNQSSLSNLCQSLRLE